MDHSHSHSSHADCCSSDSDDGHSHSHSHSHGHSHASGGCCAHDHDHDCCSHGHSHGDHDHSHASNGGNRNRSSGSAKRSGKSEALYYFACVVLLVVIFASKFKLVGGKQISICGEFGYMNQTTGLCNCIAGFYGKGCSLRYCPFGQSWLSPPTANHVRNMPLVECSNAGVCDQTTGLCACRSGYDGRACERTVCPGIGLVAASSSSSSAKGLPKGVDYSSRPEDAQECSGHGRCRSLREASNMFDGLNFKYPPVNYNNWDADKIHGCVCDYGWKGDDCSQKQCPMGKDPTRSKWDTDDVIKIDCRATGGFFTIQAFGGYTDAIPYDADTQLLKMALEEISGVGTVVVDMALDANYAPVMCLAASVATTTIRFLDHPGNSPPIRVIPTAAASRMWPSVTALSITGQSPQTTPILRVKTQYFLTCEICPNCAGNIQFLYRNSISKPISVTDSSASTLITAAINSLGDLSAEGWTNFAFELSGSSSICSTTTKNVIEIDFYSDYGNIPFLNIMDGSVGHHFWNITLTSTKGNATLYECSNQGTCDSTIGVCNCLNGVSQNNDGFENYLVVGSNGQGSIGGRGDCGYIQSRFPSCTYLGVANYFCNGHGTCNSGDLFCTCDDGYYGMTCQYRTCPKGPVLFDEPLTADTAHSMAPCSGNGNCDEVTGTCTCKLGFTGAACQIKDCPRTFAPYGEACMGNGRCVSISEYYASYGFSYGDNSNYNNLFDYDWKFGRNGGEEGRFPSNGPGFSSPVPSEYRLTYPATWDALNWFECSCYGGSANGNAPGYDVYAPKGWISGKYTNGDPMTGWTGFDCSLRECPRGDSPTVHGMAKTQRGAIDYPATTGARTDLDGHVRGDQFGFGNFEAQKLLCTHSAGDSSFSFTLTFFGKKTPSIYGTWAIWQLRDAIESLGSVGRVRVSWGVTSARTICAASHTGGIIIEFLTELGDLPLMVSDSADAVVTEYTKGSKANLECSGIEAGVCNRKTGKCECNPGFMSSSTYLAGRGYGARGDCGYITGVNYEVPKTEERVSIDFSGGYDFSRRLDGDENPVDELEASVGELDSSVRYQSTFDAMEALGAEYERADDGEQVFGEIQGERFRV